MPLTSPAHVRQAFPDEEPPTEPTRRTGGLYAIPLPREVRRNSPTERPKPISGTRRKVAPLGSGELTRMAEIAARYASMKNELDSALEATRVPVISRERIDIANMDAKTRSLLRFVNGVSTVADVIARSGLDRANALAIICRLAADRAIVLV
jgi:hypothetical protein